MRAKIIFKAVFLAIFPIMVYAAKAPDFAVTDFNNKVHKLYEDYLNKDKVVVIKFFFVGCPPCATIGPYVQQAYVRWGSGNGRVQFFEITTLNGDYNSLVKAYHNTKGFTFPGIGSDGGAQAARTPYTSGTFGTFYGTPTFVVINPKGDVNFNVPMSTSDQSKLDTAIAQALRVTNGGGGGGCSNAFSVKTITQTKPETYYIMDLLNGNPATEIKTGTYNCEFSLPSNIDGHYVIPQMNATADVTAGVSTADIVYIQRYLLGLQTFNNLQRAVSDVNNSSTISAADVSDIRKLLLGVTSKFSKLTKSYVIVHNPKSTNPFDLTDRVLVKDLVAETKTNEFGVGKFADVTGASLFANDEIINRSSDKIKFYVEMNALPNGTYEHKFYTKEAYELTGFQLPLKGKPGNFIGKSESSKFIEPIFCNFNFKPELLRMIGTAGTGTDIHLDAGECWFTIYTKKPDQLIPGDNNEFLSEFLFNNLTEEINNVEIEYLHTFLVGDVVTITQKDYSELIVRSVDDIKNIRIFNSNGIQLFEQSCQGDTKQSQIDASNYHTGIYFAKVQLSNGKVETKKFLKF